MRLSSICLLGRADYRSAASPFLECAWHAFENAGCDPFRFQGEIGIFAGAGRNTDSVHNVSRDDVLRETLDDYQIMIGSENDYLATRVAFKLDLRGPAITVQTACSTSLVVHMACRVCYMGNARWPWRTAFPSEFRRAPVIFSRRAGCIRRTDLRVPSMRTLVERSLVRGLGSSF